MQTWLFPPLQTGAPLRSAVNEVWLAKSSQVVSELGEKQKTLEAKNVNVRQEPEAQLVCRGTAEAEGKRVGRRQGEHQILKRIPSI